ncbi:MAG: addiction module antidote protein, HigA family [Betaproteobacteria bacterium]|nr:addiction module antidote protein, HigA family [Betaproteobacteria bacterium]
MTRMHNPPHPGEVLREYLGDTTVTAAATLGVNRVTLNRIVTGASGISADMAYRLASAFGTSAELWAGMQLQYDLYQAGKVKRPKIERLAG